MTIPIGLALVPTLFGENAKAQAGDWPMFNRDLAGTRFSPLTQINTTNVATLMQAWSYVLQPPGFRFATAGGASELVPIVVNGVMFISAQTRVMGLEPETGKEIWRYEVQGGQASPRGVAWWPGDRQNPPRILFTAGRSLIALNAGTGKLDPGFGKEGILDMVVPYNGVPTIFKNVVMVGASTGEKEDGPPGNTRAFDARTGAKVWEFQSIPGPGQAGHETWLNTPDGKPGWKDRSGTNIWGWYMTADEERGIVYMTFGAPAANYYGGDRPGANLFGNSVVAVDAATGKYKWHFQTIHHDIWDADPPAAPGLFDITVNGKKIHALAEVTKSGWMFILDRVTGKPVFGVEERAVPKSDVPGEETSPTQPFPLKPPALARVSVKPEDLVTAADTTAEHAQACRELVEKNGGISNAGPFTPWPFRAEGAPVKSAVVLPGGTGGANWGGTAFDPGRRYVFVNTMDDGLFGWVEKTKAGSPLPYDKTNLDGSGPGRGNFEIRMGTAGAWPCQKPPWVG